MSKEGEKKVSMQRTDHAELFVEKLLSIPSIAEFVFRSPTKVNGSSEKEVADLLIAQETLSLLTSQKCQQDPDIREIAVSDLWKN